VLNGATREEKKHRKVCRGFYMPPKQCRLMLGLLDTFSRKTEHLAFLWSILRNSQFLSVRGKGNKHSEVVVLLYTSVSSSTHEDADRASPHTI
jgi:hypothetical protein